MVGIMIKKSVGQIVGKNYSEFWHFKGRYRVVKGGRASKKSTTTALWLIYNIRKNPKANALCLRRTYRSLADSCYAELKKAAYRLGVEKEFDFKITPLEITRKSTGQKILFRGFDKPDSITSITTASGCLCWVWIEEAYEIENEEDFNKLDGSIRGREIEQFGVFPQITLTMNPWSEMWIKDRFFDRDSPDILAITRNYYHNEFLSGADYKRFADIKRDYPERYKVEGLGMWGLPGGRYFNEWREDIHVCDYFDIPERWRRYVAFDYGLDMFACYFIALSERGQAYIYREIYESDLIVSDAVARLKNCTLKSENIYSYIAPPDMWNRRQETGKSIADIFGENGIYLERASNDRVQSWLNMKEWLNVYKDEQNIETSKLKIFRNCRNLIRCIPQLAADEKHPNDVAKEPHEITHAPDAIRYFIASQPIPERALRQDKTFNFEFERDKYNSGKIDSDVVPI